jgi:hypothetical protein
MPWNELSTVVRTRTEDNALPAMGRLRHQSPRSHLHNEDPSTYGGNTRCNAPSGNVGHIVDPIATPFLELAFHLHAANAALLTQK